MHKCVLHIVPVNLFKSLLKVRVYIYIWTCQDIYIYIYALKIWWHPMLQFMASIQGTMFHPMGPNFLRSCTTAWKKQKPKSKVLKVSLVLGFSDWNTWNKDHKDVLNRLIMITWCLVLGKLVALRLFSGSVVCNLLRPGISSNDMVHHGRH